MQSVRSIKLGLRESALLAFAAILVAGFAISIDSSRAPLSSAELRFVEHSSSGLQIVPASCPSDPHYSGECGASCVVYFTPTTVAQGESSTVHWGAPYGFDPYTLSYPGGSNTVPNSGSGPVGGDQTKTYTLSYRVRGAGEGNPNGGTPVSCSAILTVTSGPPSDQCPPGQHLSNGQCVCDATNQPPVGGQCPGGGLSCSMYWQPPVVEQGQTSTLFWTIAHPGTIFHPGGSFPVSQSGSGPAGGSQTMTYTFVDGTNGDRCPATLTVCPAGQTVQNGQCAAIIPQCTPQYYCQGDNLFYRNAQCVSSFYQACAWSCSDGNCCTQPPVCSSDFKRVLNACTNATIRSCSASQTCVSGQCVEIDATITANPSLLRTGETSIITWSGTNVSSCTVTEDNPEFVDAWSCSGTSSCSTTHTDTTSAIGQKTIYTLFCTAPSGASVTKTATINVIPVWKED